MAMDIRLLQRREEYMKVCALASVFLILLLFMSCSSMKHKESQYAGLTDQQIYDKAMQHIAKKKWTQARELLRYLMENFYDSQLMMPAKLAIADSYYNEKGMENYAIAIQEYQEYLKLYPSSPKADYAQYQIGLCYFKQINKPGRDQSATHKAVEAFKQLLEIYPRSSYAQDAQIQLIEGQKIINLHRFSIAHFYFKRKKYESALFRFKQIFENSPEEALLPEMYFYYAETLRKLGNNEESKKYFSLLVEKFPRNEYAIKAAEILKTFL
jgi:outer membrane protein assembly factor BamD